MATALPHAPLAHHSSELRWSVVVLFVLSRYVDVRTGTEMLYSTSTATMYAKCNVSVDSSCADERRDFVGVIRAAICGVRARALRRGGRDQPVDGPDRSAESRSFPRRVERIAAHARRSPGARRRNA